MPINTLLNRVKSYIGSFFFPMTVGILAFLIWLVPGNYAWIPAILLGLSAFLPLMMPDGRAYLPLILFPIIICKEKISFLTIPIYLYYIGACILVSIITFIFLNKLRFRGGGLIYVLGLLLLSFLISFFYNSIQTGTISQDALLYLLSLFVALLLYALISTVVGKEETLPYLENTIAFFAIAISLEVLVYLFQNGFSFVDIDFTLGWSYTSQTASTLLCISLPFFGMLISQKKFLWIIGEAFAISAIIMLSADSGLLCMILGFFPLLLLTFRKYGRFYPYIVLGCLITVGITFTILLSTNVRFSNRVLVAIQSLNIFNEQAEWRKDLFTYSIEQIKLNPVIGTSIIATVKNPGIVILSSNTILSTLVLGGSIGLIAFVFYEIKLYFLCISKHVDEKWLFFLFLIFIELIGLIDNTIYNIAILLFLLVSVSCYQMSNRPEDVVIHESFYKNYDSQRILS